MHGRKEWRNGYADKLTNKGFNWAKKFNKDYCAGWLHGVFTMQSWVVK